MSFCGSLGEVCRAVSRNQSGELNGEQFQGGCEQRFLLAVEASLDGFWDYDVAGKVAHYSARWQAIAGFEPREHAADLAHWLERVHPEDRPRFETELKALCAGKSRRMRSEHRLRDHCGLWRWVSVRGVAERSQTRDGELGEVLRIAGSMTDQTERKMADPLTGLPNRTFSSITSSGGWSARARATCGISPFSPWPSSASRW